MRPALVVNEGPLHASREARAAASAQTRGFDQVGDFIRLHLRYGFFECLKAAVLFINIKITDIRDIAMAQEDVRHYLISEPAFLSVSTSSMVLSTVISS